MSKLTEDEILIDKKAGRVMSKKIRVTPHRPGCQYPRSPFYIPRDKTCPRCLELRALWRPVK